MIKSRAAQKGLALMAHQKKTLEFSRKNPRMLDLSDAGTGKTAPRIVAFAERRRKGGGCLLVVAPRSLLRAAWLNDFKKFAPDMKVSVANAANREKAFEAEADVYVTNHDAAKWLAAKKPVFFAKFDSLDIDEPTAFKHHTSMRSRMMRKLTAMTYQRQPIWKYRSGMTATPNPQSICDVWHQALLVDDGRRLGTNFYAFRGHVTEPVRVGRSEKAVDWQDREGAEDAVFSMLADITIRHRRKDCIDIPETQFNIAEFELGEKHRKTYEMLREAQLLVLNGETKAKQVRNKLLNAPPKITAINAAAVIHKLLQVTSGAVYDNDGKYHLVANERYELIMDLAEARKQPLIFYFWKHQLDQLVAEAKARHMNYGVMNGDTSDREREALVNQYQAGRLDGLFAHPENAAHGLTLTAGTSTIWPCPTSDLEWFVQGSQRQSRIGQKEKTEVLTVIATGTVEERVYWDILMPKNKKQTNLLELFAQMSEER